MGSKNILAQSGITVKTTREVMGDRPEYSEKKEVNKFTPPQISVKRGTKLAAVKAGLIPKAYIDCDFSIERVKENQKSQAKISARRFMIKRFEDYKDVTTGILSTIISNMLPNQSYIIGSPNGFGKTSFVNTCIMRLYGQDRKCVPYISLSDLAQVKITNEKRLLKGIGAEDLYKSYSIDASEEQYIEAFYDRFGDETYVKKPINIIDKFSWSEYMNCDILFCYFTDVSSKLLESEMLKTALTIRGAKGLPTIAMISTSLNPYKNDKYLAEYVWNEILSYETTDPSYDRVRHISCYKDYNVPLRVDNSREG